MPLFASSRRFPAFGDPSVARVDAVLAKTGLMGVESTVLAPQERRLEAHKLAGGPRIVDSTMLRALMRLESTAESRLDTDVGLEGERSGELPSSLRRHFESMVASFIDSPRAAASAIAGSSGIARCGASSSALLNLTDSPQRGLAYRGCALLGCFL